MRLRTALMGLGILLVLGGTACGNGPPPEEGSSSSAGNADTQVVTGQTAAQTVKQTDELKFVPDKISVKAGDVIEWDNSGTAVHNVTLDNGTVSASMSGGDKFQVKFATAGTFPYKCTLHPGMNGEVDVT